MENVYERPKSNLAEDVTEPTRKTHLFHFFVDFVMLCPCVLALSIIGLLVMPSVTYSQLMAFLLAENHVAITGWCLISAYYLFFEFFWKNAREVLHQYQGCFQVWWQA